MANYLGLIDMLNGGGAGRAGDTFEGGPLSNFLNNLGVRPMGYQDRLSAARPMPRPMSGPTAMAPVATTPAQPPADPYALGAVTTTSLDRMSDEELVAMIRAALDNRSTTPLNMTPAEKAPYLADLQAFWTRDPKVMQSASALGINPRAYLGY